MSDTTSATESATASEAHNGDDGGHVVSRKPVGFGLEGVADFDHELSAKARRFHGAFEPIAANVYFAPEVHEEFEKIGFGPGITDDLPQTKMTLPDLSAYYCSRAGCMGQVPGYVVVAAFGVFNPDLIVPYVEKGWQIASHADIMAARERGATRSLENIIGNPPELPRATELLQRAALAGSAGGRFLYAGLRSMGFPSTPWGALWRSADMVREFRGDSHIAAWCAAGLDPVEAGLMTEIYYEMPTKRYHHGRGWTHADLDAGLERLRHRGLITEEPVAFTDAGRTLRERIEVDTDRQQRPLIEALGDDYEELLSILEPWAGAIVEAGGFPTAIDQLAAAWGSLDD
jgi:hypothetical protein